MEGTCQHRKQIFYNEGTGGDTVITMATHLCCLPGYSRAIKLFTTVLQMTGN